MLLRFWFLAGWELICIFYILACFACFFNNIISFYWWFTLIMACWISCDFFLNRTCLVLLPNFLVVTWTYLTCYANLLTTSSTLNIVVSCCCFYKMWWILPEQHTCLVPVKTHISLCCKSCWVSNHWMQANGQLFFFILVHVTCWLMTLGICIWC